jgi:hypothetical protein
VSVNYTPVFAHKDWVDNASLVQAAGDDGFNVRFHGLEAEFKQLATVIGQISTALDELSTVPPAKPVTLSLVPVLTTVNNTPWAQNADSVQKPPSPATECSGVMNVTLPAGAQITGFRVIGSKQSGSLTVNLNRQSVISGAATQRITGVDPPVGGFDQTANPTSPELAKVDNENFRYFLTARLTIAGAGDQIILSTFQIVYLAAH